jgi:hypothetical protein
VGGKGGGGRRGEMTQALYAHMDNKAIKNKLKFIIKQKFKKKVSALVSLR